MKAGILLKILKHFCFLNTEPLISRFRPERVKFRKRFRIAKSRQVSFTSGRLTLESGGRIKLRPAFVPASLAKKLSCNRCGQTETMRIYQVFVWRRLRLCQHVEPRKSGKAPNVSRLL
jgi:hypothetical protein